MALWALFGMKVKMLINQLLYSYEEILDKFDIGKLTYKPASEVAQGNVDKNGTEKLLLLPRKL